MGTQAEDSGPVLVGDAAMPRTDSLDLGGLAAHNLTLVTGDTALLRLMLGVGLMASFTLMLGYRTRFSLGVATLVLFSFVTRQPLISLPHEVWLVGLALWSLSLPLGLRWSLDATLGQTLAPGASDTRRGGLIGLSWALQWLALAGAALTIPVQDTAASLAIAGAIALLLALVSRGLLPTPSPWRWATPMLALGGALGVLIAHRSSTALMTVAALAVIPLLFLVQVAFLVAFGVLVDALIVRTLLVPALTLDIGRRIWSPSALSRKDEPESSAKDRSAVDTPV